MCYIPPRAEPLARCSRGAQLSGVLFFLVASLGASSVVGTYLGALYGVAGGTVYLAGRAAVANARLEDTRRAERAQQLRGGRSHAD